MNYTVSDVPAIAILPSAHDYVLAVDGKAVVQQRSYGSYFLTFFTPDGARVAASRVRAELPDVAVLRRGENGNGALMSA